MRVVVRPWFAFAILLAACGPNSEVGHLECTNTGNAKCGTNCLNDNDCGLGLFCDDSAKPCAAECVFGGSTCHEDQFCSDHGKCTDAPEGADLSVPPQK